MTLWVTHSPRNIEDQDSVPGIGRYIVSWMKTYGGPQSLRTVPSGRLKNHNDADRLSSLSLGICQALQNLDSTCTVGMGQTVPRRYSAEDKYTMQNTKIWPVYKMSYSLQ